MITDLQKFLERSEHKMKNEDINEPGVSGLVNIGNTCYMNATLQNLLGTDILTAYLIGHDGEDAAYKGDLKNTCINDLIKEKNCNKNEISETKIKKKFRDSLTYALRNLFLIMYCENCSVKPETFKSVLDKQINMFRGCNQKDAHEFLVYVLDKIHDETKSDVNTNFVNLPQEYINYIKKYEKYIFNFNMEGKKLSDYEKECYSEYMNYRKDEMKIDVTCNYLLYWKNYLEKNKHSSIIDIFHGLFLNQLTCEQCNNTTFNFGTEPIISLPILNDDMTRTMKI